MNVLRSFEEKIAGLVEGTFGRVFRSQVQPIQLAHKLTREMDEHRTVSMSRVYAPNEFLIWLSPADRDRYDDVEDDVIDELAAYALEHARREGLTLAARPVITFHTDERLSLGRFGIQARRVRVNAQAEGGLEQAEHGHTMIYSASERSRGPARGEAARARRAPGALLILDGKRMPIGEEGALIGRSRDCDVVVGDENVSRHHAEVRLTPEGWTVTDLGSTNGVRVNGRAIFDPEPLVDGDRIELGATELVFEER